MCGNAVGLIQHRLMSSKHLARRSESCAAWTAARDTGTLIGGQVTAGAEMQRRAWLQTSMRAGLACAMTSFTIVLLACGHSVFSRWLNHVSCAAHHDRS